MHRSEIEDMQVTMCASCGEEISAARDRAYVIGEDEAICFSCAIDRGGEYDELEDRWTEGPDLAGVPSSAERA